jgi:hypothetical protein
LELKDKMEKYNNAFDRTVFSLCCEIDALKEESRYWKDKYKQERSENNSLMNEQLATAQRGVANALMFALSVSDNENGDLVIKKEDRKVLAENYK